MGLLGSINRLKRLDSLIRMERTGTAEEFAKKIGISRSMLMENLREMRELGAMINYCAYRRSYFYANNFDLVIGKEAKNEITGGENMVLIFSVGFTTIQ